MAIKNTDIKNIGLRPICNVITNENGERIYEKLNDRDFINLAIDKIGEYETNNNEVAPIEPSFLMWLRQAKEMIENGENLATIKAKTLNKGGIDFNDVVNNTNRMNRQQEKNNKKGV